MSESGSLDTKHDAHERGNSSPRRVSMHSVSSVFDRQTNSSFASRRSSANTASRRSTDLQQTKTHRYTPLQCQSPTLKETHKHRRAAEKSRSILGKKLLLGTSKAMAAIGFDLAEINAASKIT